MLITKKSPLTGNLNTLDLDITTEQMERYLSGGEYVQNIFPNLSGAEREFIMTGYTESDWNSIFGAEEY